jgi:hypothetical protein
MMIILSSTLIQKRYRADNLNRVSVKKFSRKFFFQKNLAKIFYESEGGHSSLNRYTLNRYTLNRYTLNRYALNRHNLDRYILR